MTLKRKIIEKLSKELSLPFTGIEQDWELEMADPKRINDFLDFYEQNSLSNDEKAVLMSLILASYDDYLNENNLDVDDKWHKITAKIRSEKDIFSDLLEYWKLPNETGQTNLFKITPLVRMIKD